MADTGKEYSYRNSVCEWYLEAGCGCPCCPCFQDYIDLKKAEEADHAEQDEIIKAAGE